MSGHRLPVATLKAMLFEREGLALIAELCPGGRREGNTWSCPNPSRSADAPSSFKVWLTPEAFGAWIEYDADERGDLISLIALSKGIDAAGAIGWARRRLGLDQWAPEEERKAAGVAAAMPKPPTEDERRAAQQARAFQLFAGMTPVTEDEPHCRAVRHYLHRRSIHVGEIEGLEEREIRAGVIEHWMSAEYEDGRRVRAGYVGPCMGCAFRDRAGRFTGLHGTWLTDDGRSKAPLNNPKLMLGKVKGSIVRLTRGFSKLTVEEAILAGVTDTVILGEGMESMLSVGMAVPEARVWAAGSLVHIGYAPIDLPLVGFVAVAQENDTKPQARAAFQAVLEQLMQSGKPVQPMRSHIGNDFNDTLS